MPPLRLESQIRRPAELELPHVRHSAYRPEVNHFCGFETAVVRISLFVPGPDPNKRCIHSQSGLYIIYLSLIHI